MNIRLINRKSLTERLHQTHMTYLIPDDHDGRTIRDYLKNELKLSRSLITRLKYTTDGILLNGNSVTVRWQLRGGDNLTLALEDTSSSENIVPNRCELSIIYEDECLLAVNKPRNMPVHPSLGHYDDTLANYVMGYYTEQGRRFVFRAINRLDRDTTGVVIIAKDAMSAQKLVDQIKERAVEKSYLALIKGDLSAANIQEINERLLTHNGKIVLCDDLTGYIDAPISREAESIITRAIAARGSESLTRFSIVSHTDDCTLLRVYPQTGRTHQIRVHFSGVGCPLVGDSLYGSADETQPLMLHCERMSIRHPQSGESVTITASPPADWNHLDELATMRAT